MLAVIQSRFSSLRLPGKALLTIGKQEILGRCIQRVKNSKLISEVLVATSIKISDQAIVDFCTQNNVPHYRGSNHNLVERLYGAANSKNQKSFVRICGDSPFIDPIIIDEVINIFISGNYDIATNVFPRTFPKGHSVEVIKTNTMCKISKATLSDSEKEHATSYIYNNHTDFKIGVVKRNVNYCNSNHSIDEKKDLETAEKAVSIKNLEELNWMEIEKVWSKAKKLIDEN